MCLAVSFRQILCFSQVETFQTSLLRHQQNEMATVTQLHLGRTLLKDHKCFFTAQRTSWSLTADQLSRDYWEGHCFGSGVLFS